MTRSLVVEDRSPPRRLADAATGVHSSVKLKTKKDWSLVGDTTQTSRPTALQELCCIELLRSTCIRSKSFSSSNSFTNQNLIVIPPVPSPLPSLPPLSSSSILPLPFLPLPHYKPIHSNFMNHSKIWLQFFLIKLHRS